MGKWCNYVGSGKGDKKMHVDMDKTRRAVRELQCFCQAVRIVNTKGFCLNFLYCSLRNNSHNNESKINLSQWLTMVFLMPCVLCMIQGEVLPGRKALRLCVKSTPAVRTIVFLWVLHICVSWLTDHLSLKWCSSCLLRIIIGIIFQQSAWICSHLLSCQGHNQFHETRSQ